MSMENTETDNRDKMVRMRKAIHTKVDEARKKTGLSFIMFVEKAIEEKIERDK